MLQNAVGGLFTNGNLQGSLNAVGGLFTRSTNTLCGLFTKVIYKVTESRGWFVCKGQMNLFYI